MGKRKSTTRRGRTWYRLRHVHSSGRFDGSIPALGRALRRYATLAPLITFTELVTKGRWAVLFKLAGYKVIRETTDPAILFRVTRFRKVKSERWLLTKRTIANGRHVVATAGWLFDLRAKRNVLVVVAHLPAHLGGVYSIRHGRNENAVAWLEAVHTLNDLIRAERAADPELEVILVCDWNLDHHSREVCRFIQSLLPGMSCSWHGGNLPKEGSHDQHLIDATWTTLTTESARVEKDDPSSDHRPIGETLRIFTPLDTAAKGGVG